VFPSKILTPSSVSEKRTLAILRAFCERGPINKYGLCRWIGAEWGSEPTILYTVRDLEAYDYVEVVRTDKDARGGQPSKYYDVSLTGLAKIISRLTDDAEDLDLLDRMAKKYKTKIPQVFELWPLFRKSGITDVVRHNLAVWCDSLCESLEAFPPRTDLHGRSVGRKRIRRLLEGHEKTYRELHKSVVDDHLERVGLEVVCRGPALVAERVYLPIIRTHSGDREYDNRAKHWLEAIRHSELLRRAIVQRLLEAENIVSIWMRETNELIQQLRPKGYASRDNGEQRVGG
jgi:hypothetical protein